MSLADVLAPSPNVAHRCECGHPAAQHWIGGPPGSRTGCEAEGCTCGQAVKLPNLNITARSLYTPGEGWRVVFYFDHVFLVGDAAATTARLVEHWQMTPEVAQSVVGDLYNWATATDNGEGVAEVLLVDEEFGDCDHPGLDYGDPGAAVVCEFCGVEMEFS